MFRFTARSFLVFALAAAAIVAGSFWFVQPHALVEKEPLFSDKPDAETIGRGRYIARLGDCVACHTEQGSSDMAGGLALETPFGKIYSTNITPDTVSGIGGWSFAAFDRAMRHGIAQDGHRLYPAMPYPSYAKITEADMSDLWAYLRYGLEPVRKANKPNYMRFPFNQRWGLAFWDKVFARAEVFRPNPGKDAQWNRGAYLVQGLGHCGACHTPRGIGFQEVAMSDHGEVGGEYLSGAQVENWNAINLRGLWDVPDMMQILKTGQNRFSTVSGAMTDVISHSTQYFSVPDLTAMAVYLKSLSLKTTASNPPDGNVSDITLPMTPEGTLPVALWNTRGGLAYAQFCADCHRANGQGVSGIFPPLVGNPVLNAQDPSSLIHIMLTGWQTPSTHANKRTFTMPSFARLDDSGISEILNYVRSNWSETRTPITSEQISSARHKLSPSIDATPFVTPRLADLLKEPNAEQLVMGMRLIADTKNQLPDNVGNVLNCSSCHLNAGTVADSYYLSDVM